jgi:exodeoxyribonuclease VII small subunit
MSKAKTFEEAFGDLTAVVERLQEGDLPLEESITLFERGMRLSFQCERFLEEADRRIEMLVRREDGNFETEPYDEPNA